MILQNVAGEQSGDFDLGPLHVQYAVQTDLLQLRLVVTLGSKSLVAEGKMCSMKLADGDLGEHFFGGGGGDPPQHPVGSMLAGCRCNSTPRR